MSNTEQTRYTVLLSDHNGLREVATYETPEGAADALDNIATGYAAATGGEVRSVTPGRVTVATAGGGFLADLAVLATHRSPEGEPTMTHYAQNTAEYAALVAEAEAKRRQHLVASHAATTPAPQPANMDGTLATCAAFMQDCAADDIELTGREAVEAYLDAHHSTLDADAIDWLAELLDTSAFAIATAALTDGEVASTGGGCYALVVWLPDGSGIYATDGDQRVPTGKTTTWLGAYGPDGDYLGEQFDRTIEAPHTPEDLAWHISGLAEQIAEAVGS